MTVLLSVSIAMLAGLMMTRALKPLKLPDVTAYLVAGVLVGPYCLGALGIEGAGMLVADVQLEQGEYEEVAFAGGQAIDLSAMDDAQKDMLKKEIVSQAAKLSLSLVAKPGVMGNLMTIFGGAIAK